MEKLVRPSTASRRPTDPPPPAAGYFPDVPPRPLATRAFLAPLALLVGIDGVRATGNDSILVIPGAHMGQGTDVWLTHAAQLTDPAEALVFDVHAYERWLLDRDTAAARDALRALDDARIPWMVGEIAPMNAGTLMDPRPFLALPEVARRPVTAWLWKRSDTDLDALLDSAGNPNDRDNHAWGSTVRALAAER